MLSMAATEARLMIETTFLATSEKLWPGAASTFGNPRSSSAQNRAKNPSIAARPPGVICEPLPAVPQSRDFSQITPGGLRAVLPDHEHLGRIVKMGVKTGQPLVLHQHEEPLLGQISRHRGIKAARPILD